MEPAVSPLPAWDNFYVIVGSSAAALTGLQFVVMTLITQAPGQRGNPEIAAFGTPTIVHFCAVLLDSAILSAPWHHLSTVGLALGICGGLGVAYSFIVLLRARRQTGYRPVMEDWIWHTILPFIAYGALLAAGARLARDPEHCLFAVAGTALLLLFIGIHNSWDTVTYIAVELLPQRDKPSDPGSPSQP